MKLDKIPGRPGTVSNFILLLYRHGQCYSEVGGEERSLKCCKYKYEREILRVPSNVV